MPQVDKFTIGLEFDTDGFKKSIQDIQKQANKFTKDLGSNLSDTMEKVSTEFGQKVNKNMMEGFTDSFKRSSLQIKSSVDDLTSHMQKSFGKVFTAISGYFGTKTAAQLISDFANTSNVMGVASSYLNFPVSDLYKWTETYKRFGGSAEGFRADAYGLQQAINATTVSANPILNGILKQLGLDPSMIGKEAATNMPLALTQIFDQFRKLPKDEAQALANKIGINDPVLFNMMMSSQREQFMQHVANQGLISQNTIQQGVGLRATALDTEQQYRTLGFNALAKLTPLFELLLKVMSLVAQLLNFLIEHSTLGIDPIRPARSWLDTMLHHKRKNILDAIPQDKTYAHLLDPAKYPTQAAWESAMRRTWDNESAPDVPFIIQHGGTHYTVPSAHNLSKIQANNMSTNTTNQQSNIHIGNLYASNITNPQEFGQYMQDMSTTAFANSSNRVI